MKTKYNVIKTSVTEVGRFKIVVDTVLEHGIEYPYSYVKLKDSVGVLAFWQDKLILIKQYRHNLGGCNFEIPGGAIEMGASPKETAARELKEETGYIADRLIELGSYYPSPGATAEECHLFLAFCDKKVDADREPLEYMETELVYKEQFEFMISEGSFKHSMGLVAWMKYNMWRKLNG